MFEFIQFVISSDALSPNALMSPVTPDADPGIRFMSVSLMIVYLAVFMSLVYFVLVARGQRGKKVKK